MYFGKPVRYDHNAPAEQERKRICRAMADGITGIACSLPEHTIVPYPNMPSREYPTNRELTDYEQVRFEQLQYE